MKKNLFLALLCIPLISGCSKINDLGDDLTKVNVPISQTITLPALPIPLSLPVDTINLSTNLDSVLNRYGVSTDLIESVSVKSMKLTLTSPSEGDLSYISNLNISTMGTGLDATKIAWIDEVPDNCGSSILLSVSDTNLKDYFLKDNFGLIISGATDKAITEEQKIKIEVNFTIDLKLLGL